MTGQEMKQALDECGVRITEAADIFRVANSTLYRWLEGEKGAKSALQWEFAVLRASQMLIAKDMMLLPPHSKGKQRLHEIKNAIRHAAASGVRA